MPTKFNVSSTVVNGFGYLAKAFTWVGVVMIMGVVTVVGVNVLGPSFEGKHFPVMTDMDIAQVDRIGDQVEFKVSGRKVRQCTFKSIGALSLIDGEWQRSIVSFGEPNGKPNRSGRPMGQQSYGSWFTKPTGNKIKFVSTYRCHDMWDTVSELGEVDIWPRPSP